MLDKEETAFSLWAEGFKKTWDDSSPFSTTAKGNKRRIEIKAID